MNLYGRQLSADEIERGEHRDFVGGLWEEIGRLQFEFMCSQGLRPEHRFIDVGCGALRGGLHFVRYLAKGRYYGLDINASLLEAGRRELDAAGLSDQGPQLVVDDGFRLRRFETCFDFGLALSVFTHLPMNAIVRCLSGVAEALAPEGVFYASYFPAPAPAHLAPISHGDSGVVTYYDVDPYHQSVPEMQMLAGLCGLQAENLGAWGHPRGQHMLAFRRVV